MRNRVSSRLAAAIALLAVALLWSPALLFAHAHLVRASPAANTRVAAPIVLGLWFSEKPELRFTTVTLKDSAGATVSLGSMVAGDSMSVRVPIDRPLAPGPYTVTWRTAGSDGHASSGSYRFAVVAPTAVVASDSTPAAVTAPLSVDVSQKPVSNAVVEPAETATFSTGMRWVELVALLTAIGLVVFRLAVLTMAKWAGPPLEDAVGRALPLVRAVLLLFGIATLTRAFAQAELLPLTSESRFVALTTLVRHTRWGFAWAIGAGGAVVAIIGTLAAGKRLAGWVIAAVGLVAICASEALTGHSGSTPRLAIAVATDVSHLLGAGGWLGGLTALMLCGLPALRPLDEAASADAGGRLLRAYHGAAIDCVAIVILSAVAALWLRLPSVSSLWTTPYGMLIIRKTVLVIIVLLFGLYHWRRVILRPWSTDARVRFQRTAIAELLVGAVIVAITAVLVLTPLP